MLEKSYTEEKKTQEVNSSEDNGPNASTFRLALIGLIVITPAISPGMAMSYSAIALRQLNLNLDQSSWFASIMSLATPFGNLFTGFILDRCGRRISMILCILPSIIGWFLLSLDGTFIPILYTGRLLTGFALGAASLPSTVYMAECSAVSKIRGSLASWTTLALGIGSLLSYALGVVISYKSVALVATILSIISLILILIFIPESPVWLYRRGRIGDALLAESRLGMTEPLLKTKRVRTLSENGYDVETEFTLRSFVDFAKKIKRKDVYKPLIITIAFLFCLQFCGIYSLTGYMVDVIDTRSTSFNPYLLSVISGTLQCIGILMTMCLIPYTGVKNLSMISATGVALGMMILGLTITFNSDSSIGYVIDWIHVLSVWFTVFAAGLGFVVIPYAILGEMFPMGAKSYASLSLIASSAFNFVVLKLHPILFLYYGPLVYFIYAVVAFSGSLFVGFFLPETVGKTLEEIKNEFRYSSDSNRETVE